ncbi:hypothetical protein [Streptomyces xylophagus]|uniref:hypothetical protein n=1 Tax=Streptomyces xylophagus TaxID=285514 RepID=UPI00131B11B6|nr:hypothetical protein [Streptomyces xylophagus]
MLNADSYRGARRNNARREGWLKKWRNGMFAVAANDKAKLNERAVMANSAREEAARALVAAGVLAQPTVATAAMLDFYSRVPAPRSRVVNRIIRDLRRQMPAVRAA